MNTLSCENLTNVGKFLFAIACLILALIPLIISNISLPIMSYLNLFLLNISFGVLGDFFGILMRKSQKVGFILYVITCSCFGGLIGSFTLLLQDISSLGIISNAMVSIIALAVIAVFTVINWLLVRNLEIKN